MSFPKEKIAHQHKQREEEDDEEYVIVANRFIIEKKIGKGSFGEVYKGSDLETNAPVAIKIELSKTFQTKALFEGKVLSKFKGFDGIPQLYYSGTEGEFNVVVLELLGPNLEDLLNYCDRKLSLKTVLMIAIQLVRFIHRDIKSDNFLIGLHEDITKIYAIDFGLSKRYLNPQTGQHTQMKKHKGLVGTARFASVNAHLGLEQSRRDDLQALGYLLVYLAKGKLPWQNVQAKKKTQKYKKILDLKDNYTPGALCVGLPEFEETPNYFYLRRLFLDLLTRRNLENDLIFDWMLPAHERGRQKDLACSIVQSQYQCNDEINYQKKSQSSPNKQQSSKKENINKLNQQALQNSGEKQVENLVKNLDQQFQKKEEEEKQNKQQEKVEDEEEEKESEESKDDEDEDEENHNNGNNQTDQQYFGPYQKPQTAYTAKFGVQSNYNQLEIIAEKEEEATYKAQNSQQINPEQVIDIQQEEGELRNHQQSKKSLKEEKRRQSVQNSQLIANFAQSLKDLQNIQQFRRKSNFVKKQSSDANQGLLSPSKKVSNQIRLRDQQSSMADFNFADNEFDEFEDGGHIFREEEDRLHLFQSPTKESKLEADKLKKIKEKAATRKMSADSCRNNDCSYAKFFLKSQFKNKKEQQEQHKQMLRKSFDDFIAVQELESSMFTEYENSSYHQKIFKNMQASKKKASSSVSNYSPKQNKEPIKNEEEKVDNIIQEFIMKEKKLVCKKHKKSSKTSHYAALKNLSRKQVSYITEHKEKKSNKLIEQQHQQQQQQQCFESDSVNSSQDDEEEEDEECESCNNIQDHVNSKDDKIKNCLIF